MNIDKAMLETIELMERHKDQWRDDLHVKGFSIDHMHSMKARWSDDMSDTKKCRWLGWMQAVVCVCLHPTVDLDTVKEINMRNK